MSTARETTNKLYEMMEEGVLDAEMVAQACLVYMSEDDVKNMARLNGFFEGEEEG